MAQREWFVAARERVYVGDVHDAKLLAKLLPADMGNYGPANGEPARFVDFAAPIYDGQGRLRGVVGAHAHWRWVTAIIDAVVRRRQPDSEIDALIVNRDGAVLYPEALTPAAGEGPPILPPALTKSRLDGLIRLGDGRDYLLSEAPLLTHSNAELGWRIVARQPLETALRPVRAQRQQLLVLGTAVAVMLGLSAWWLARRISRPVEELARIAQQIEQDHREPSFPSDLGSRELAALSDAMRSMTQSLLDKERQLQSINISLEAQVLERTAALQAANAALEHLATRDPLTSLHNRRSLDARLAEAQALDRRYGRQNARVHALLIIDVDHFKQVNDRFGHLVGDAVLRQLSALLLSCVRATDVVARFGGEEFAVLLPECASALEAVMAGEKIRVAVAAASFPEVGRLTVSIGVSMASPDDAAADALIDRADAALYEAKRGGRNAVALKDVQGRQP